MRVIKVESCKDCPYDYRGDCEAFDWDQREPIPESCPLPKWPSVTQKQLTEIIKKYVPCHCDPAYTARGLTAPDCPRHAGVDEITLAEIFKEIGVSIEEVRDD